MYAPTVCVWVLPAGTKVPSVSPWLGERLVMMMRWSRRLKSVGTTSTVIAGSYSIAPLYNGFSGCSLSMPATGATIYKRRKEGVCGRVDQWMLLSCLRYTVVNRPCRERATAAMANSQLQLLHVQYFLWFMLSPHTVQCSTCYKKGETFCGNAS